MRKTAEIHQIRLNGIEPIRTQTREHHFFHGKTLLNQLKVNGSYHGLLVNYRGSFSVFTSTRYIDTRSHFAESLAVLARRAIHTRKITVIIDQSVRSHFFTFAPNMDVFPGTKRKKKKKKKKSCVVSTRLAAPHETE
uniref:Uncharacterized protein n=1 Tax=Caenorhabditis japonica TaxID=281687 RepID=A0A8R1EUU5_CAEJA